MALHRERVAAAPGDVPELRLLSSAYLAAHNDAAAADVIAAGLELAPGDAGLTYDRGELKARRGDATSRSPAGAAPATSTRRISPASTPARSCWSGRDGWLRPPVRGGRSDFATGRGWELTAVWPRQELQRVLGLIAGHESTDG